MDHYIIWYRGSSAMLCAPNQEFNLLPYPPQGAPRCDMCAALLAQGVLPVDRTACRTTPEHDVWVTFKRHRRRKNATVFGALGSALVEELNNGAVLSPDFVERFTCGTRMYDDRVLRLTPSGRAMLAEINTVSTVERNVIR